MIFTLIVLALVTGLNLLLLWSLRRLVRAYRNECRAAIAQRDGARAKLAALEAGSRMSLRRSRESWTLWLAFFRIKLRKLTWSRLNWRRS